jgi:hypothetical protein
LIPSYKGQSQNIDASCYDELNPDKENVQNIDLVMINKNKKLRNIICSWKNLLAGPEKSPCP